MLPEKKNRDGDSIFIYSTPSRGEIAVIKSILEENNIPYFIDNEAAFG